MSDPTSPTPPASPAVPCTFDGFEKDAEGCYPIGALLSATKDCTVPEGTCYSSAGSPVDDTPPPPPPKKPRRKPVSDLVSTPKPHREPPSADHHADDFVPAPVPEHLTKALEARRITVDVVDSDGPPPPPHQATTEAPAAQTAAQTAVGELSGLLPKDGSGGSAITVMLALIAVAGGGAGWKFYQSFAKQKHEQRMKELEIKEKKVEQQGERQDDHKACEAARAADRAALEAKIEELSAKLAKQPEEKAPALADLPFDPEELNDRLEQIERALKKAPSKPKKGKEAKEAKDAKSEKEKA